MPLERLKRELSSIVLCAGVLLVLILFGERARYEAGVYYLLVAVQLAVLSISACSLAVPALRSASDERKTLAVAGFLLIAPWLLFSLVPGLGTPWQASPAENQSRYIVLLWAAIAVGGGMVVLRQTLSDAGERLYAPLGFAAILMASPLYLVWGAILFEANFVRARGGQLSTSELFITDFSDVLLYFGGLLTYVASAAFVASLGRTGWLGRAATGILLFLNLFAVLFLIIRGPQFPDPKTALDYWYNIPGFVAGIPAIPWLIPCVIGIAMLRRAGRAIPAEE